LQNSRIHINPPPWQTRWAIAIGIFYYLLTVNFVGLTHEHGHEHEHDAAGSEHCSACFFIANHIGIASHAVDFTNLDTEPSIHSPFDLTFSTTKPVNNNLSRAPPTSSV
jgi:hypothetical protein